MRLTSSRTRIRAVLLRTFSCGGVAATAMVGVHLRDQMTFSRGSMRGLVPLIKMIRSTEILAFQKNGRTVFSTLSTQERVITGLYQSYSNNNSARPSTISHHHHIRPTDAIPPTNGAKRKATDGTLLGYDDADGEYFLRVTAGGQTKCAN